MALDLIILPLVTVHYITRSDFLSWHSPQSLARATDPEAQLDLLKHLASATDPEAWLVLFGLRQ